LAAPGAKQASDGARPAPRYRRIPVAERREMLEDAALACLSRGGIAAFTIDNICAEAGVSRGLVAHHYASKEGLLAAAYARMYTRLLAKVSRPDPGIPRIVSIIEDAFSTGEFSRPVLAIWLTLWGEAANNPALRDEHRRHYDRYRSEVAAALSEQAVSAGRRIDAQALATMLIALIDGLSVECVVDPDAVARTDARDACYALAEAFLGPIPRP
jgi:TetR/AcrR family transcriptional regulator, transcriptional repressor of bet genes